jgi:hypothetical protein
MRKLMIGTGAALALALAGCEGGAPEAANEVNAVVPGPEATENRLETMPEGQRNAVFFRGIQDAGYECQNVVSSEAAGEHQGFPIWTARCINGREWTIVIGNDGTASVLNPAEAQLLGGNEAAAQNAQGE